jgi:hypothetical protein
MLYQEMLALNLEIKYFFFTYDYLKETTSPELNIDSL